MQLTTEWTRNTDLPFPARKAEELVHGLRSVKVFKKSASALTLFVIVALYWFFATIVWRAPTFWLIGEIHQSDVLKPILILLSLIGIFVVVNELLASLFAASAWAIRIGATSAAAVLAVATTLYWARQDICSVLCDGARENIFQGVVTAASFVGSNCFLLNAVVLFPLLGSAFLLKAGRNILRSPAHHGVRARSIAR
jgi:hypothetical protein